MKVLQLNNQANIFEVDRSMVDEVLSFLKDLARKKQKSFSYIDDLGDMIVVKNGEEYVVPSVEDIEAIQSRRKEDYIDEEELKALVDV